MSLWKTLRWHSSSRLLEGSCAGGLQCNAHRCSAEAASSTRQACLATVVHASCHCHCHCQWLHAGSTAFGIAPSEHSIPQTAQQHSNPCALQSMSGRCKAPPSRGHSFIRRPRVSPCAQTHTLSAGTPEMKKPGMRQQRTKGRSEIATPAKFATSTLRPDLEPQCQGAVCAVRSARLLQKVPAQGQKLCCSPVFRDPPPCSPALPSQQ